MESTLQEVSSNVVGYCRSDRVLAGVLQGLYVVPVGQREERNGTLKVSEIRRTKQLYQTTIGSPEMTRRSCSDDAIWKVACVRRCGRPCFPNSCALIVAAEMEPSACAAHPQAKTTAVHPMHEEPTIPMAWLAPKIASYETGTRRAAKQKNGIPWSCL